MIIKQLKGMFVLAAVFGIVSVSGAISFPAVSQAQTSASVVPCDFTGGNLEIGVVSEEVRCLQKYLNSNGFKITEVGVGSPGSETAMFGSLTAEAVKRWQMSRGVTPTGTFGPLSKAEYLKHVASLLNNQLSGLTTTSNTSTIFPVPNPVTVPAQTEKDKKEKEARKKVLEARDVLEDTKDDVDDADSDEIDVDDANNDIEDAEEDLLDALIAFVNEDYDEAIDKASDVIDSMEEISDDLHGDDNDAEEAINDAQDAIDEADEAIDEAYEDGDDVDEARDLLDDAEDKLDDAQDAFDDEDYEEAEELADEAEDLANDAMDAL